jgi:mannose-6-phosphate isomerase-like protein (cupin superfamily)
VPIHVTEPLVVPALGEPPKIIREYVGAATTRTAGVSVARMSSPAGWGEPFQRPDFDEVTLVLSGAVLVESAEGTTRVDAGQAVLVPAGERVRYSTPEGAEYVAVCTPAFTPDAAHRDP